MSCLSNRKEKFLQQFKRWSTVVRYYKDAKTGTEKHTSKNSNAPIKYGPDVVYKMHEKGLTHAICPIHNKKTHLIWFDIDGAHDPVKAKDLNYLNNCEKAAHNILNELKMYGINAELSCSSVRGNYHIYVWTKNPQSVQYCETVQREFLKSVNGLEGVKVEIGPMKGKSIRPYFIGKNGYCITEGNMVEDLSGLLKFYKPAKAVKESCTTAATFDISQYIPTAFGQRHNALLGLVRATKNCGWNDEQVKNAAIYMHENGVVKDSIGQHLEELNRILKGYNPLSNKKGIWTLFWREVEKGLNPLELFRRATEWSKRNGLSHIILTMEQVAKYYDCVVSKAHKILHYYIKKNVLKVVFKGSWHKASLYLLIEVVKRFKCFYKALQQKEVVCIEKPIILRI